jgi:hypothetical protein
MKDFLQPITATGSSGSSVSSVRVPQLREKKELKGWVRRKKIALIEKTNPTWSDLSETWFTEELLTWTPK